MKTTLFILIISLSFFEISCRQEIKSGEELIKQMHEKYLEKWFNSIAFEQDAIFYENGKVVKKQIWYEASKIPGKLIIKYDSLQSGNGAIFASDSVFVFQNDSLIMKQRRIHDLLVLSLDVYAQPVETTISKLKELDYDLNKIHINIWHGKEVYVVGATKEDTLSPQFWIEKDRLLFVRLIGSQNGKRKEVIFNNYKPLEQGWIEQEVIFKYDNDVYMREIYSNIRIPKKLTDQCFDTENFKMNKW